MRVHHRGVTEADVHDRRHGQTQERAIDRLDRDPLRRLGVVAHPGLVELDDVGAGRLQVVRLRVDRGSEVHHHLVVVVVELVLGLLGHGERAGQRDLRLALGVAPQERHVADLDRVAAPDFADDARHLDRASRPVRDRRRRFVIDALERGGEAIGVTLAAHLAIGDDVDAGALHVADRQQRRVVLRLGEVRFGDPPQLLQAHARHHGGEHGAVDKPVGLWVAAHDRGRQQMLGHADVLRTTMIGL